MEEDGKRPLKEIAEAFSVLADNVKNGQDSGVDIAIFARACDLISILFSSLGIAFKFAEKDYVSKVKDLLDASKEFDNIAAMVDSDIQADKVKQGGSHTRNLLRVKRGIDMVRLLFQHVLTTEGNSLKEPATKAYDQVFAPYHSWPIRKAVAAGMYVIPTKSAYLAKLNEKESSAKQYVQIFVTSAEPVVQYVDDLFTAKDIGVDW
ncbi:hypothetical protein MPTK1_1g26930 [Marchantia polymorpha subsp. ruderalis]|uniref:Glycolipid transfer protein domain-containing protein n=2 Tax=Marchantia polymorpha TaxID=3197 RepID=A0A176W0H8_MARPO|nr:hypothetical protein AXG93_1712s1520 [Marchantia polymorpha subsp. ruderalis]PTQ49717.1 hypothetical protein MARPO_0002s0185 [Marchantia polymorpha]BBN00167.1 hypothetical protein Mp_1g26930 [Marchantia polymorpha subsp. ruderalis]|eukprot:PTQ49717.1 hypothetical protein MARPO_0002s0185 [Marchantia polymorpha]